MGFLEPHFGYDVFVSYSHGVRTGEKEAPLREWTLELIRQLETDIWAANTEFDSLHIWRDEQIDPTIYITDELREKVSDSGILLVVMSPRYLASPWCKDELDWFRQQVQDRQRDQGRVFVIRAMRTKEPDWPDFLRDLRGHALPGFQFHDLQSEMPYRWRESEQNREAYARELWRLHTAFVKRLRELRANAERRANLRNRETHGTPPGQRRIYLHTHPENPAVHDEIRRVLLREGISSLSTAPDSGREISDLMRESRARIEIAKRCDALALLRTDDDERFIGDLLDIGIDERERIQSTRGTSLPCAVLDRSRKALPIDVSCHGIERFDLADLAWCAKFHGWLYQEKRPESPS